ncbi:hypothetical protein LNKW23_01640 [Paralimibaculum aggregatum]|uniref:Uncharacterized protein n=1 Tax=Paralimibaculum aggregatum TaxID=3036245 RepID=A0ABQ6LDA4_9RHOB|nr:hypothetical protein [Limibaculum sp. NKW23]GMG80952.1 hypothetical protein LNKW23_01640 [Limibaculum sp. NKW23]
MCAEIASGEKAMRRIRAQAKTALEAGDKAAKSMPERQGQWSTGRYREGVDTKRLDTVMAAALRKDVKESRVDVYQEELRADVMLSNETMNTLRGLDKLATGAAKAWWRRRSRSASRRRAPSAGPWRWSGRHRAVTEGMGRREDTDRKEGA